MFYNSVNKIELNWIGQSTEAEATPAMKAFCLACCHALPLAFAKL